MLFIKLNILKNIFTQWSNPAEKSKIFYWLKAKVNIPLLCSLYSRFFLFVIVSHKIITPSKPALAKYYNFAIGTIS